MAERYNDSLAAVKTVQLIDKYDIGHQTMVSTFSERQLDAVVKIASKSKGFIVQLLTEWEDDFDEEAYEHPPNISGVSMKLQSLNENISRKIRADGGLIGIWFYANKDSEDEEMWRNVFTTGGGVDFFYSDHPLEAMQVRDAMQGVRMGQ